MLCLPGLAAQPASGEKPGLPAESEKSGLLHLFETGLVPEFLVSGSWESEHNLTSRFDFKLTAPGADLALRLEMLDRRPASGFETFAESFGGETGDKAITQPALGLYHLSTGSRALYGALDTYGLPARIRNVWVRGAPYAESRAVSSAELKTAPASTAIPQGYACLETPALALGPGEVQGFASFAVNDDVTAPAFGVGVNYAMGQSKFGLEGLYTERTLPERKSSTWFNEKPALPERDTRLFAGAGFFSLPAFGLAADLAYSETFAFGRDYYGSLGLRFGDKPWRFSVALDAAGSRYVDSAGNAPGQGFRSGFRLERQAKKSGLFRLSALFRGPGPDQGLPSAGDFTGNFNRMSGELYYRFPTSSAFFGPTRFSFSLDRDGRDEKKVLDSARALAAFKLGPVTSVSEGRITGINSKESAGMEGTEYLFDSFRLSQNLSMSLRVFRTTRQETEKPAGLRTEKGSAVPGGTKPSSLKNSFFTLYLSARAVYEKTAGREGSWDTSFSASIRGKRNRLTFKAAASAFPKKWEYTISWRMHL
jgi:hypothetical protein